MDRYPIDRREFLKVAGATGVFVCGGCAGVGSREPIVLFDNTAAVRRFDLEIAALSVMEADLAAQKTLPRRERKLTYVDATVGFDGEEYTGQVRFKGNSSLLKPLDAGQGKLPLKVKFGKDGRFHGLRKINLQNNFKDPTMVRELLTTQLFARNGAYAPRAVPVRVHVNGEYWGVYTLVEQVDKTFLQDRFGDKTGNLYKPSGLGGQLKQFIPADLNKKTNRKAADYSDIEALVGALADPATAIGSVLDVSSFVSWLAVSAVVGHYDSYIGARQNYYLYNNPATGLWSFISWDHNISYGASYLPGFGPDNIHTFDVARPFVGERPLTERVLAEPQWRAEYDATVDRLVHGSLGEELIGPLHDAMRAWVYHERTNRTLLTTPLDFDRNLDEGVLSHGNFMSPGVLDFIEKRRDFLG